MTSCDKFTTLDPISTVTRLKVALLNVPGERNLISLTVGPLRLTGKHCFFFF